MNMVRLQKYLPYVIPIVSLAVLVMAHLILGPILERFEIYVSLESFLLVPLIQVWGAFFFHWRLTSYRMACLLPGLSTAILVTLWQIVSIVTANVYPRSMLLSFAWTFLTGVFISSFIGILPFTKHHRGDRSLQKRLLLSLAVIIGIMIIAPVILVTILMWPSAGYYAEFNAVREQLEAIPDVTIVNTWQHKDLTLEDCGVTLKVRECPLIQINFYEGGDWETAFQEIQGIRATRKTGDSESVVYMSTHDFQNAGLHITNLVEMISHLEQVLDALSQTEQMSSTTSRIHSARSVFMRCTSSGWS